MPFPALEPRPWRLTLSTVAVPLADVGGAVVRRVIMRNFGPRSAFLGGPGVTPASGYEVKSGETLDVFVHSGSLPYWGVTATGVANLSLLSSIAQ